MVQYNVAVSFDSFIICWVKKVYEAITVIT